MQTPTNDRPTILSSQLVQRAINDPGFFTAIPEFRSLERTVQAAKAAVKEAERGRGCSSCKKRQIFVSVFSEFVKTANSLPQDAAKRLKAYFGVTGLLVNIVDPATRQTKLVRI